MVPPAHIFVLTTAFQPEVLNPPISEVVGKGDDTPERHQSPGSREHLVLTQRLHLQEDSHFICCVQTTGPVVVKDGLERAWMSVEEELVV